MAVDQLALAGPTVLFAYLGALLALITAFLVMMAAEWVLGWWRRRKGDWRT